MDIILSMNDSYLSEVIKTQINEGSYFGPERHLHCITGTWQKDRNNGNMTNEVAA
jgi:hypothetical protein